MSLLNLLLIHVSISIYNINCYWVGKKFNLARSSLSGIKNIYGFIIDFESKLTRIFLKYFTIINNHFPVIFNLLGLLISLFHLLEDAYYKLIEYKSFIVSIKIIIKFFFICDGNLDIYTFILLLDSICIIYTIYVKYIDTGFINRYPRIHALLEITYKILYLISMFISIGTMFIYIGTIFINWRKPPNNGNPGPSGGNPGPSGGNPGPSGGNPGPSGGNGGPSSGNTGSSNNNTGPSGDNDDPWGDNGGYDPWADNGGYDPWADNEGYDPWADNGGYDPSGNNGGPSGYNGAPSGYNDRYDSTGGNGGPGPSGGNGPPGNSGGPSSVSETAKKKRGRIKTKEEKEADEANRKAKRNEYDRLRRANMPKGNPVVFQSQSKKTELAKLRKAETKTEEEQKRLDMLRAEVRDEARLRRAKKKTKLSEKTLEKDQMNKSNEYRMDADLLNHPYTDQRLVKEWRNAFGD